jgi:hypothetical protein
MGIIMMRVFAHRDCWPALDAMRLPPVLSRGRRTGAHDWVLTSVSARHSPLHHPHCRNAAFFVNAIRAWRHVEPEKTLLEPHTYLLDAVRMLHDSGTLRSTHCCRSAPLALTCSQG